MEPYQGYGCEAGIEILASVTVKVTSEKTTPEVGVLQKIVMVVIQPTGNYPR